MTSTSTVAAWEYLQKQSHCSHLGKRPEKDARGSTLWHLSSTLCPFLVVPVAYGDDYFICFVKKQNQNKLYSPVCKLNYIKMFHSFSTPTYSWLQALLVLNFTSILLDLC